MMSGTELSEIMAQLEDAYTTKLFFTDLNGRLKNLSVNPKDIESILKTVSASTAAPLPG